MFYKLGLYTEYSVLSSHLSFVLISAVCCCGGLNENCLYRLLHLNTCPANGETIGKYSSVRGLVGGGVLPQVCFKISEDPAHSQCSV